MAMKLYSDTSVQNIADSIRKPLGDTTTYKIGEMATGIDNMVDRLKEYIPDQVANSTDNEISVSDAVGLQPKNVNIDGNSYQETRSGRNAFPPINAYTETKSGVTFTSDGKGNYKLTGTNTSSSQIAFNFSVNFTINNPNYTLHMRNNKVVNGGMQFTTTAGNVTSPSFSSINRIFESQRFQENSTFRNILIYVGADATTDVEFSPSIEEGTTETTFEEYGVSPSPDYSSEVEVIDNGYNLFNAEEFVKEANAIASGNADIVLYKDKKCLKYKDAISDLRFLQGKFKPNTQYTIKFKQAKSGYEPSSGYELMRFHYTDGTEASITSTYYGNDWQEITKTTTAGKTIDYIYVANYTSSLSIYLDLDTLILNEGTEAKPFIPYNNIGLKFTGKNFFDISQVPNTTYITNNGNYLTISGITSAPTGKKLKELAPNLKVGETYLISADTYYNQYIYLLNIGTWLYGYSRTITQADLDADVYFYGTGGSEPNNIYDIQIEKGTQATTYEQHKEVLYLISLNDNFVGKLPNGVKDELSIDKYGDVKLTKRVGKVVLDGSENWRYNNVVNQFYINSDGMPFSNYKKPSQILSNNFIYSNTVWQGKGTMGITSGGALWCVLSDSLNFTNANDFKTWLSTHNTEVYYELETPYEVNLGKIDIRMLKGTNNIELISNLGTTFDIDYYVEFNDYINNTIGGSY